MGTLSMLDVQELTYPATTVCLQRKQEAGRRKEDSTQDKRENTEARDWDESRETADRSEGGMLKPFEPRINVLKAQRTSAAAVLV